MNYPVYAFFTHTSGLLMGMWADLIYAEFTSKGIVLNEFILEHHHKIKFGYQGLVLITTCIIKYLQYRIIR